MWTPGSQTPDWNALAADAERQRKRRRLWAIGGGVLAAAAIGTAVALVIVNSEESDTSDSAALPDPQELPPDTTRPQPTFEDTTLPPLPQPREFISDPDKDLAPFEVDDFFVGDSRQVNGRTFQEVATAANRDCAAAAAPELGEVLTEQECISLLRATYTAGEVAVTVGVAQFPSVAHAEAARKEGADSNLRPLTTGDAPTFCQRGGCSTTTNQVGRYAYFTIAGNSDGSPASGDGVREAARDGNDLAFELIIQRGEAQASASASARVEERENRQNGD